MNRADYYCSVNKFDVAQADYEKVVEVWPDNFIGYLLRGRNQLSLGRYAGVVDDMGQVIEAYEEADLRLDGPVLLFEAHLYRGIAYLRLNRSEEAIADITLALQMRPQDVVAMKHRADAYLQAGDLRSAVGDLTHIISLQPKDADAYNRRGFCYMNLKEYPPALADFDRAIALDPQNGQIYNNRAFIHFLMKDKVTALKDAEMAEQLGFAVEHAFLDSLGHAH
jgi:tetratricopeptide (TPR) repeat protein